MFRINQKVVCVDTSGWDACDYQAWSYPRKGDVVTVTGLSTYLGKPTVFLAEHNNDKWPDVAMRAFYAYRFRPIVERKTSIEIFQRMLNPSKRSVDA